jgi:hypothetical protein
MDSTEMMSGPHDSPVLSVEPLLADQPAIARIRSTIRSTLGGRPLRVLTTTITLCMSSLLAFAGQASADDQEVHLWQGLGIGSVSIPSGSIKIFTYGQGINVLDGRAEFVSLEGPITNWWMDFNWYDLQNRKYRHVQGNFHGTSNLSGDNSFDLRKLVWPIELQPGRVCAVLYTAATSDPYVSSVCSSIKPS